jgi:hypothetical protein
VVVLIPDVRVAQGLRGMLQTLPDFIAARSGKVINFDTK